MNLSEAGYPSMPAAFLGKRKRSRQHARKQLEAMVKGVVKLKSLDVFAGDFQALNGTSDNSTSQKQEGPDYDVQERSIEVEKEFEKARTHLAKKVRGSPAARSQALRSAEANLDAQPSALPQIRQSNKKRERSKERDGGFEEDGESHRQQSGGDHNIAMAAAAGQARKKAKKASRNRDRESPGTMLDTGVLSAGVKVLQGQSSRTQKQRSHRGMGREEQVVQDVPRNYGDIQVGSEKKQDKAEALASAKTSPGAFEGSKLSRRERKRPRKQSAASAEIACSSGTASRHKGSVPHPQLTEHPRRDAVSREACSSRGKSSVTGDVSGRPGGPPERVPGHQQAPSSKLLQRAQILQRCVQPACSTLSVPLQPHGTASSSAPSCVRAVPEQAEGSAQDASLGNRSHPKDAQSARVAATNATRQGGASDAAAAKIGKPSRTGEPKNGTNGVPNSQQVRPGSKLSGAEAGRASRVSDGPGLAGQLSRKLQGSFFRYLNEQLYTTDGASAYRLMQEQPQLFEEYHKGFQSQTLSWPQQPVDAAIAWLKGQDPRLQVADFGCGDARLAANVPQKVHCLDLVAAAPGVIACNMADTPLETGSVDIAVFCLALMGTDYPSFLAEAARVLKKRGRLWVAEVRSRFAAEDGEEKFGPFVAALKRLGFELRQQNTNNRMFVTFILQKKKAVCPPGAVDTSWPDLKPCIYKRR
eukprot:jgi/Botrbrau1/22272/Bobra.0138s0029.2